MMRAYRNALTTANALALSTCLMHEKNQNHTVAQKMLLRWHFKLGRAGFQLVRWLGKQGNFGARGEHMAHADCNPIKCRTCNLGKQQKTANPAKQVIAKNPGALKKDVLQPGQVMFSDQYQTQVLGKPAKGKDGSGVYQPYKGGTIFCDAASRFIHVEHQVTLTSYKTIAAKINFERIVMEAGVTVTTYHTDNGIY